MNKRMDPFVVLMIQDQKVDIKNIKDLIMKFTSPNCALERLKVGLFMWVRFNHYKL
jgi:uncharacterized protein YbbK (DUF523 family)